MSQALESAELIGEITKRGYAELEHGIPPEEIDTLIGAYTDFTRNHPNPRPSTMCDMLPEADSAEAIAHRLDDLDRSKDTKDNQPEWHKYRTNTDAPGKPKGYTNRSFQVSALFRGRGIVLPHEDPKEYYHHTPHHLEDMQAAHAQYGWGPIPPEVYKLDRAFSVIHQKMTQLMLGVCCKLEVTHPGIRELIDPEALQGSPLRLLFYHPSTEEQLAAGHYDKGDLTVQIAESHQGLRVATQKGAPLQPVVRDPHLGVLFAGYRLSAPATEADAGGHFPDSPLLPAWHDVMSSAEVNIGRGVPASAVEVCARWSLIFFAGSRNFLPTDKSLMHTQ